MLPLLLCIALLTGTWVSAHASPVDAVTMNQLGASQRFLTRTSWLAIDYAEVVRTEDMATICHAERLALASRALQLQDAPLMASVISRSNAAGRVILGTVIDGATGGDVTATTDKNQIDSSAPDLALTSALNFYWNTIARCPQPLAKQ